VGTNSRLDGSTRVREYFFCIAGMFIASLVSINKQEIVVKSLIQTPHTESLTERAKSPIRRDREFFLSSDVCLSVSSGLEVTVFKRF